VAELSKVMLDMKIGIVRVEKWDAKTDTFTITMGEDLDCSGLPITGETVCNYDEGFIAGILQTYNKKKYHVREIDCWASGDRVCRFRRQAGRQINREFWEQETTCWEEKRITNCFLNIYGK
jgi:predicted hydrocarbon binding protein